MVARAFTELGYRRATTAQLAQRCGVRENILYRLWPDKKAMFIAAIDYVYELSERTWLKLLASGKAGRGGGPRLLDYESEHHGEFGHYRIIFHALAECSDPDICEALQRVFVRFHRFLAAQILAHRRGRSAGLLPSGETAAWAVIGLGTIANITRELHLLTDTQRRGLIADIGQQLMEGTPAA